MLGLSHSVKFDVAIHLIKISANFCFVNGIYISNVTRHLLSNFETY